MQCGNALGDGNAAILTSSDGELKQVTVLFADVSESTALIEHLDPEHAHKRLTPALDTMKDAVSRFDGTIVQALGDGVMAMFGTPVPHEDHALRACSAALAIQDAIKALPGATVTVRVGIHSGEVLARTVTAGVSGGLDTAGLAIHIARRLEQLAPAGGIALSSATLRRAGAFVSVKPMGPQQVRGLSVPLDVFLLVGLQKAPASLRFATGRSHFVGRNDELARLERALEHAARGEGRIVGIIGDAGVGKSRLCFEFIERCRARGIGVVEGGALSHDRATPYAAPIQVLKSYFQVLPSHTPEQARRQIGARLQIMDPALEADLPLLVDFLGLSEPDADRLRIDPTVRRQRLLDLFRRLVKAVNAYQATRPHPGVALIEDLHWMDEGSASLFAACMQAVRGARTLYLVNYRPGFEAPWMKSDIFEQIALPPLAASTADALADRLLGDDESVAPLLPLIADRARGNPLFIEELVRQLQESGHLVGESGHYRLVRAPDARLVPDTVQAIIGTRIDSRPAAEKSVLQIASVVGREFEMALLARLVGNQVRDLRGSLGRLSSAALLAHGGNAGFFAFKHPMIQDVAYRSMVSERRRAIHASVAAELEQTHLDPNGAQASLIAYHWEEAADRSQAIAWHTKAAVWYGTPDLGRPLAWEKVRDPARAVDAWKKVHRLLADQPSRDGLASPRLLACMQLMRMGWREGMSAADLKPYYADALEIGRSLGSVRAMTWVRYAYGQLLTVSGSATEYVSLTEEALAELDPNEHASLWVVMTGLRAQALRLAGDLRAALAVNDVAVANADKVRADDAFLLGVPFPIWVRFTSVSALAHMGRFDEARVALDALSSSNEPLANALQRTIVHSLMSQLGWLMGDAALATSYCAPAQQDAERSGHLPMIAAMGLVSGLAQSAAGEATQAMATLSEALHDARRPHAGLDLEARVLCYLGYIQLQAGLAGQARATAQEAAVVARRRGTKVWLAFAERLLGGPDSPAFRKLVEETGAEFLLRLPEVRNLHPAGAVLDPPPPSAGEVAR